MTRLRSLVSWLVLVLALGGWSVYLRPPAFGGETTYVFVSGHSMLPTYRPGDLVPVHRKATYRPGDVVAFTVDGGRSVVIHRVRAVTPDGAYVLRGDNQSVDDPWQPTDEQILGAPLARIPRLGRVLVAFGNPLVLGLLCGVTAGLVAAGAARPRARPPFTLRPAFVL